MTARPMDILPPSRAPFRSRRIAMRASCQEFSASANSHAASRRASCRENTSVQTKQARCAGCTSSFRQTPSALRITRGLGARRRPRPAADAPSFGRHVAVDLTAERTCSPGSRLRACFCTRAHSRSPAATTVPRANAASPDVPTSASPGRSRSCRGALSATGQPRLKDLPWLGRAVGGRLMRTLTGGAGFIDRHVPPPRFGLASVVNSTITIQNKNPASLGRLPAIRATTRSRTSATAPRSRRCSQEFVPGCGPPRGRAHVDRSMPARPRRRDNIVGTLAVARSRARAFGNSGQPSGSASSIIVTDGFRLPRADGKPSARGALPSEFPYAASRRGRPLVSAWHTTYGLPAIVTNCTNTDGINSPSYPACDPQCYRRQAVTTMATAWTLRDWLQSMTMCGAASRSLHGQPGRAYNVGARPAACNVDGPPRLHFASVRLRNRGCAAPRLMTFAPPTPAWPTGASRHHTGRLREVGWRAAMHSTDGATRCAGASTANGGARRGNILPASASASSSSRLDAHRSHRHAGASGAIPHRSRGRHRRCRDCHDRPSRPRPRSPARHRARPRHRTAARAGQRRCLHRHRARGGRARSRLRR
jgi:dTDP-glucose 4,6-dehydratase